MPNDPVAWCDNCHRQVVPITTETYPDGQTRVVQVDNGAAWNLGGGYAEFIDTLDFDTRVILCHNCVLGVFKALPGIVERFTEALGSGWHPFEEEQCCEFGWTR